MRLGYGQAERVAAWYAESYVTLDRQQSRALGQQLADFKQWHCSTQLTGYSAWLRQAGEDFQPGIDAGRMAQRIETLRFFARVVAEHAAPRVAALTQSIREPQITELTKSFARSNRKYREQWIDRSEDEIRAERSRRLQDRIRWWTGPLHPPQRALVADWSRELRLTGPATLASRERWQRAFVQALHARGHDRHREAAVRTLLADPDRYWTPDLLDHVEANRALTVELLVRIANSMDEAQRTRVRARAASLAADLDALACPGPGVVADAG